MGIIVDIILALIILINIYICYEKGLVKLAVGLVAVIVAVIMSIILCKPVSNLIIEKTQIDDNIENAIIVNFSVEEGEIENNENKDIMEYIEKYVDDAVNKTKNQVVEESAGIISEKVINVGVILAIFIIVRIVLIVFTFIADLIAKLPILKQVNDIGGLIYGIIKSLLIIYVLLAITFFVIYITGNTAMAEFINNTYITKFFYNNNLLITILF